MNTIDFSKATVLITGGSEGIGLGVASRFLNAGSTVLVTGRNHEKLKVAAEAFPGLLTFVNDIGVVEERERLATHVRETLPGVNVVIHNAGIQRRVSLAEDHAPWAERQAEIDILLSAPVHLNHLLVPTILEHGKLSLIANVTSGGAYIPQPFAPLYSACKAALHSYTVNLRFALANTTCKVIEIIPPAVRTALAGPNATHGASLDDFCNAIFAALIAGECDEIGYGMTASPAVEERLSAERKVFASFSERFPVRTYDSSKNDAPLSARERQVWHAVKTLSEVAFSVVVREVESATGMSSPDFAVLSRLEELGTGRVSQKTLADSLSWDKSRLSHHLTRMEARNLLVRKPSAEGSGVELEILPEGRKAIAAARPIHARAIRAHILRFVSAENSDALIALAQHLNDAH